MFVRLGDTCVIKYSPRKFAWMYENAHRCSERLVGFLFFTMIETEEFLNGKRGVISILMDEKPDSCLSDDFESAAKIVLLVYSQDSPLVVYPQIKDRMDVANELFPIGLPKNDEAISPEKMIEMCLGTFLTKFQFSYEYEHLVTCQIVLLRNNRELRSNSINSITDAEKKQKAAVTQGTILENNSKLMDQIQSYTKKVFGDNNKLAEKMQQSLRVEDMIGKNSK